MCPALTELQVTQLKLEAWHSAQLDTWHPGTTTAEHEALVG